MSFLLRRLVPLACAVLLLQPAGAQTASSRQKVNPPPSAELAYAIKAKLGGIAVDGDATVRWSNNGATFSVSNEARAMLVGKILDARSEGGIDASGLLPQTFSEKRFRKDRTTTTFDRDARLIRFSSSPDTQPMSGNEQDRTSAVWQLIALARGTPSRARTGGEWQFMVAGQRDAEPWLFKVVNEEVLDTPSGTLRTVHIVRAPQADSKEQQLDIWLAPEMEWYPVRLRFSDANGDYIEQTIRQVNRGAS